MNEDFVTKINKMSLTDLITYRNAVSTVNRFVSFLGIGLCLLLLAFMNAFTLVLGGITLYVLGNIGAGLSDALVIVKDRIEKLDS
jgi:hypothetical protein